MDIFMRNIPLSLSSSALKAEVAAKIHHRDYSRHSPDGVPLNFKAVIFPRKGTAATRCGTLTLPTRAAAEQFLREFSGITPSKSIIILGTIIRFSESRRPPRPDILEEVRRSPYTGPEAERRREQLDSQLREKFIAVTCLQFGWECRDDVLSIEWERKCDGKLTYSLDDREFRIKIPGSQRYHIVVIHAAQVRWASAELDQSRNAAIYFSLGHPPSYETEARESPLSLLLDQLQLSTRTLPKRHRWSSLQLDKSHGAVAPYTSLAIRVVCGGPSDLETFRWISRIARLGLETYAFPTVRRGLFCEQVRNEHYDWLRSLHWKVAFQAESLTRELLVDLKEMSTLRGRIEGMVNDKGVSYTAGFLRHLAAQARLWFNDAQSTTGDVVELFVQCEQDYVPPPSRVPQAGSAETFDCLHLTVTPTTIYLSGPFPERSNRIIRQYPDNQDCFLRVNFTDEYKLQFRFDREVDGSAFVRRRVGGMLSNGIHVAGRLFKFLAYSQSALKDHAVWFVTEFITSGGEVINAPAIIAGLGTFHGLEHDPKLINCPARYGARISQAFTTTDPSISVEAEEVFYLDDIKDTEGKWCFTDGVGTISPELARDVWKALRPHRPGNYRRPRCPHAFQLRLMGSKGMVSIDHRLSGRAICLRPSMIKFQAPHSRNIEVARAFDKPSPFYLNRPLIMVLEDLGVPYSTFQDLQDAAVQEAERSTESLGLAARLMERFGLGTSFRLSSVFLSLEKLGVGPLQDVFWKHMMDFAINHVLRDLKHHARIPVPGAWNVVGIADVYGYLEEGQIFVHIAPTNGEPEEYLEGPTLVTRSPIIHPGDVQIAHSIGKPPPGSPFERTSFRNCVVFSTKGEESLIPREASY